MATLGDTTPIQFALIDHSSEQTSFELHFPALEDDGSNLEALVGVAGAHDVMNLLVATLTTLNYVKTAARFTINEYAGIPPASGYAQRELAIRFTYVDTTTTKKYQFTIGGPDELIIQSGTDIVDLGNLLIAAFITGFEANCVSPEGNGVNVLGARIVGRAN